MRFPFGTPADGDVPIWSSTNDRAEWGAQSGGVSVDVQNQLNALALGQGITLPVMPQYYNIGGQGNRNSIITVTNSAGAISAGNVNTLVNGSYDNSLVSGSGSVINQWVRWEFPKAVIIEEIMLALGPGSNGTWKWRGSQDQTNWADLTSNLTFTSTSGTGTSVTDYSDYTTVTNPWLVTIPNPFAWKHLEVRGVSGSGGALYLIESFFKILGLE